MFGCSICVFQRKPTFMSYRRCRWPLLLRTRGVIRVWPVNTEVEAAKRRKRRAIRAYPKTFKEDLASEMSKIIHADVKTLTCTAHGGNSKWAWIQPCYDSSCPPERGFLWEKSSPGQSGPLWTCSRHTRVASKPGNTQITRLAAPASGVPATQT